MKFKTKPFIFYSIVGLLSFTACNSSNQTLKMDTPDHHTSQTSLDWSGTYSGILPCADCSGIETEIKINPDNTFVMISMYLKGSDNDFSDTIETKFEWLPDGNTIKIIDFENRSPYIKIEENKIKMLDIEGKEVEGVLAEHYILTKNGNTMVEEKKWQLIELNGKEIENSNPETHYLIFDSKTNRASTKVGCNVISYQYKISHQFKIEFSKGISTMMACPENIEDEYINILETVDNLSVNGDRLTLNKARMAPLAVFKLIE